MSLFKENRGPEWPFAIAGGLLIVAAIGGFLTMYSGGHDTGTPQTTAAPSALPTRALTPSATPTRAPAGGPQLKVTSWGRSAGQLAVVVRNDSPTTISRARLLIIARDASGDALLTRTGTPADVCCTVVGLAPGGRAGLFTEVAPGLGDIRSVEVRPIASTVELGKSTTVPAIEVSRVHLRHLPGDTVVEAEVTATGELSGYVAAQAVLLNPEGAAAQVISGRFYCFDSGRPHTVRLHLFHPVPRGLHVGTVLTQAIPHDVNPGVPGRCS